jgi:hypothetical protein
MIYKCYSKVATSQAKKQIINGHGGQNWDVYMIVCSVKECTTVVGTERNAGFMMVVSAAKKKASKKGGKTKPTKGHSETRMRKYSCQRQFTYCMGVCV